nr:type VI secretion system transmembrane protein TssO [Geofilum rubicundum]
MKIRYADNIWDNRYKAFLHVSDLYELLLTDKKKTWTIGQNINNFRQNLEACEIGLEQKNEELNKIRH